jgi:ABC-type polysaccharide/polyol phosphate export permease
VSVVATPLRRRSGARAELAKLAAFFRRDLLNASSYRLSLVSGLMSLGIAVLMFSLVGRMVDPQVLPVYGGVRLTYMEFAATGLIVGALVQIAVQRMPLAVEGEQVKGTLESLLMTPTRPTTLLVGSAAYDAVLAPLRVGAMLALIAVAFGLRYDPAGAAPAALLVLGFLPFVWGVGLISAALKVTFRQGSGAFAVLVTVLTIGSGAYVPVHLLPEPAASAAPYNPIAVVTSGLRESLVVGDASALDAGALVLPVASVAMVAVGAAALWLALRRERRRGTVGLY